MSQNVSRLKELLFDRETATLAELEVRINHVAAAEKAGREALANTVQSQLDAQLASDTAQRSAVARRVDDLFDKTGTPERFRTSVAAVLDGALRDAEITRHTEMSRAIAPLVVKTIKTELRNSQDEMVEALYPITGRMVKAYVASAMRDLTAQINRRLSGGTNPLMLRLRSLMTGRSVAELVMAETQQLEVVELFLIRRGAGELVQHWPIGPQGADVPSNMDIHLSGVLTAINDFATQALKDDGGNLRAFALDDFQMYLRASPVYLLAAKCRGMAPAGVEAILDEEFLALIDRNRKEFATVSGQRPPELLATLAQRLGDRLAEQQRATAAEAGLGFNPLKAVAGVIIVPLLAYAAWSVYTTYETGRVRNLVAQALTASSQMTGYPTQVDVSPRGLEVILTGLAPSSAAKTDVIGRLRDRLTGTSIVDRLTVLPNPSAEMEPQLTSVRRDLAGFEVEVLRSTVRRAMARGGRRLDRTLPELGRLDAVIDDAGAKATVRTAVASIERVSAELKKLQARVNATDLDVRQLSSVSTPLHALSEQIKGASLALTQLLSRGPIATAPAHGDAPLSDVADSAEDFGAAAEQLATIAVAVSQSAAIKPVSVEPSARERLERWVKANAIFFGDGTDYRNVQGAQETLAAAARLIKDAKAFVRVVGYTDERGGQSRNASLAITRAQRVLDALAERGISKSSMVAIGRPPGIDISPNVGAQSPNRRVEFEIGFDGEALE